MKRLKTFVSPRSRTAVPRVSGSPRKLSSSSSRHQQLHQLRNSPRKSASGKARAADTADTTTTVSVDELKEQVSLLRERIEELDETSDNTSSDDSKENCDPYAVARNQQQEFGELQSQFQDIQRGLSHVEEERRLLRESKTNLEQEKQAVQRQLEIREKEVMSLAKRCQSQDEKMREATKLRASYNDLSTQLEGLKSTLSMKDEEVYQVAKLRRELEECQEARRELKTRLFHLKKDHDDVVDTLNNCFQNLQRLQEKQQENDDDRKRDSQRSDLMLERQRLAHQEALSELKGEVKHRQERIEQMEKILRDNMATSTALRRERVELKESLENAISTKEETARKLTVLEQDHQSSQKDCAKQLEDLRSALNDKDSVIESMETEVSNCMDKLMALSEEVETHREEKEQRDLENQESNEKLEQENWSLKEQVSTKDLEVTVLTTSVSILESDKAELVQEMHRLEDRIKELEEENAFIMDLEQQLDDVNFSMIEAQDDNARVQEAYDQAVKEIQAEFDQQRQMWNEMEKGLMTRVSSLENEKNEMKVDFGAQLTTAQAENAALCYDLESAKRTVAALQSDQMQAFETASNQTALIIDVEGRLEKKETAIIEKDATIAQLHSEASSLKSEKDEMELGLRGKLLDVQKENVKLQQENDVSKQAVGSLQSNHMQAQNTVSSQSELIANIQSQLERKEMAIIQKDETITQLREELESVRFSSEVAESEEITKHTKFAASLQQQLESELLISDSKSCDLRRVADELKRTREMSKQQVSVLKSQLLDQEVIVASLTEKLNDERCAKMNSIKEIQEENDSARQGWMEELDQANELLNLKRKEVETLQLNLVAALSKSEKEQIAANRSIKLQSERLESMERDLHDQQRQLQQKITESERLKTDLLETKEQTQIEITALMERGSEDEQKIVSLEVDLRRERSAAEGKESALTTMGIEMGDMRQQLADKERNIVSLQKEVNNLRTSLDQNLNQSDKTLTDQVRQMSLLSTKLSAKATLLESLAQERDVLNDQLKRKDTDLCNLEEEVSTQRSCAEELRSDLQKEQQEAKSCQGRIQELETGLEKALTELTNRSAARNSLADQLSSLREDMQINEATLKSKEEMIALMEQECQRLTILSESKVKIVEELKNELNEARAIFDSEVAALQKKQAEQDRTVASLQAAQRQDKLEIHQKEATISTLSGDVESLRFKFDQDSKALTNEIAEKKEMIASKDAELACIKSSLETGTAMLGQEVKNQTAKVCTLSKTVSNLEYEMEEKERKARAALAEKEAVVADLRKELDSMLKQKQASDEHFQTSLSDRETTIDSLGKRIETLLNTAEEQTVISQAEIKSLKHNLQRTEIDLAISQDELRDIQMIDLKEAEETIESLESSLEALRTKLRNTELGNQTLVNELRGQIDQLASKLSSVDKGSADTKHLHDKTVLKIQGEVDALRQHNEALNDEVKQQFEKLNERHAAITNLTAEKAKLERTESRLRGEIESLETDCRKAWEEQEKAAYALEREIGKQFSNRQDEDIEFQKRQSSIQRQLETSQSKIASLQKQVAEAEETIEGRTKLLADMVAHNKETEEQKENSLADLATIREEAAASKSDLDLLRQELARLKSASTKKEDQLLEAIQIEREMREVAEVELENAHAKMHNSNREDKELSELQKENEVLRDKVRRQEAYLKRKLQKDKVIKERSAKPSGIATPSVLRDRSKPSGIATPSRNASVRKAPASSARKGRLTPLAENLFPDELDEILS